MSEKAGNVGAIAVVFRKSEKWNQTFISSDHGQVFSLVRPLMQWHLKWTLYDGDKEGKPLFQVTKDGKMYHLQRLSDMSTVEVNASQWKASQSFDFNGRTYIWHQSHGSGGFRLNAFDEEAIHRNERTIFAKFKLGREIRIYEAGTCLPAEIIILSGFVADHVARLQRGY